MGRSKDTSDNMPTVRRGDRGDAVRMLQALLPIAQDGAFEAQTDAAVRAWQRARGLTVDGIAGPQTWGSLGWLTEAECGADVQRFGPTPHRYGLNRSPQYIRPIIGMTIHYTASPRGKGQAGTDKRRLKRWSQGRLRKSSTHLIVTRRGGVIQMAPLYDRAWHAPWVSNRFKVDSKAHSPNPHTISIDLESVGWLQTLGDVLCDSYGRPYDGPRPFRDRRNKPWEPYPAAQVETLHRLCAAVARRMPWLARNPAETVQGHSEINLKHRPDPGPALDMDALRCAVAGAV